MYTLLTDFPAEEEIANALYKPSYISFEYALAYYNMLPEMPYLVTSATTKPTRLFTTAYMSFAYYTIKPEAYIEYSLVKKGAKSFLIAEPEKAIVDYLYFESIGKRPYNDRLVLNNLNKDKLVEYAEFYQRKSLNKIVQTIVKNHYDNR
jgi:predicted transcriptional regulator of viral defense system